MSPSGVFVSNDSYKNHREATMIANRRRLKGKTYGQLYDEETGIRLREVSRKRLEGKTHVLLYGKVVADKISLAVSKAHSKEKNFNWKGDDVGYLAVHEYIRKHYGKAVCCINPLCSGKSKRFCWSKKDHNTPYTRNIKDYQQLCASCHKFYDLGKLRLN